QLHTANLLGSFRSAGKKRQSPGQVKNGWGDDIGGERVHAAQIQPGRRLDAQFLAQFAPRRGLWLLTRIDAPAYRFQSPPSDGVVKLFREIDGPRLVQGEDGDPRL